ncbi:lamin tail domain-containing protein, partial [bacterium]|nr:lamin tail domain-containing protein [bacterium]
MISPTMELRQIVSQGGPTPTARKTSGEITLEGSGVVKVRALDVFGRWSALAEAFFQYEAPLQPGDLSISEIHYQPARPATEAELAESASRNGFEFLELRNERDFTIELDGAEFVRGVRFTFPPTQLAPGERVVVVRNEAAFAA